jgi:hypothetical protein
MPLLRDQVVRPKKLPKNLKDDDEVFYISATKEVFRNYKDYIERLELYKKRIWTCKATGERGLSYTQALNSEQRAKSENTEEFPPLFIEPALHLIQHSTSKVDQLADEVCSYFGNHYLIGEIVKYNSEESSKHLASVKIVSVEVEDENESYKVAFLGQSEKTAFFVKNDELLRSKVAFSRKTFKKMLRKWASKEQYPGAPWLVKSNLLEEYPSIPTKMPDHLCLVEEQRNKKRKKSPKKKFKW